MERWGPEIEKFTSPKFFTLTLPGDHDLERQIEHAQTSFRRLMHTSLGPRNWPKFISLAYEFSDSHCEQNNKTDVQKHNAQVKLKKSIKRLESYMARAAEHYDRPVRFRDLIDKGVRVSETTYSSEHGYHFHYHAIADMPFFPWELLVVMWKHATKGEGQIVDIRQIDDNSLTEIFKYSVKGSSIPFDQQEYVREILHGKKRVWAIGNISFVERPKTCPDCGKLLTECKHIDLEFGYTRWKTNDEQAAEIGEMFEVKFHKSEYIDVIQKVDGYWQSVYIKPDPVNLIPYVDCAPGDLPSKPQSSPNQAHPLAQAPPIPPPPPPSTP